MVKWLNRVVEVLAAASTYLYRQAAGTAASTTAILRLVLIALLMLGARTSFAGGIVLDGSFGTSGALPGPNYMIQAGFGKTVGNNLFHSFNQFNLISSESATFTGPSNIQNIVSRITGGTPSSIDGTINSQIQGANLFFVNPAGVMFGPNAQIEVSGSFAVSTANYLKLADGGRFNANLGGQDTLTSAPVSAFGFLNQTPAGVSVTGTNTVNSAGPGLTVAPGKSLSIVARNVIVDGGFIGGEGARVNLVSVQSPGEVQFDASDVNSVPDVSQFRSLGEIDLTNFTFIDTSGASGGAVAIDCAKLVMSSGAIQSETTGSLAGGAITVHARESVELSDGGYISTDTVSDGKAGDILINTGSMKIDGSAAPDQPNAVFTTSESGATGNAGDLTIKVAGALTIAGSGAISDGTLSPGRGGNVSVEAGSLTIDGSATPGFDTGIFVASFGAGTGDAGNLTITVDKLLSIVGGGLISASTFSSGNGGDVSLHAGSLSIDGSATPDVGTGITADTFNTGNAGNVTITVDKLLSVAGRGQISARTFSDGAGGSITIHAGSFSIDGSATPGGDTGIFVASGSTDPADNTAGATGDAGNLTITVDGALSIAGGGQISAETNSRGKGGNVTLHAGSLLIDGSATPDLGTGVFVDSNPLATGDAGNLVISVDKLLSIVGAGLINAATFSSGKGGSISIHAGSISIDGSALPGFDTGIFAASDGSGEAGSVFVDTVGQVQLKHGGSISTFSQTTDAGSIDIISRGIVTLTDRSRITVSAGQNGGDIHITTPDLIYLLKSQITAAAGINGGNITINPRFIVLNNSLISAEAGGQGGNINLLSDFLFNSSSLITATGSIANGTINITAPALDLGSQLITLPSSLVSAENQLRERCTALLEGDFSSFISIGRGGTEPEPEELQSEF